MLLLQALDGFAVLLFRIVRAHALPFVPSVPFGALLLIPEAGTTAIGGRVADGGLLQCAWGLPSWTEAERRLVKANLLVQSVQEELVVVTDVFRQALRVLSGGFEVCKRREHSDELHVDG